MSDKTDVVGGVLIGALGLLVVGFTIVMMVMLIQAQNCWAKYGTYDCPKIIQVHSDGTAPITVNVGK